ncbi:hypothetical protein [Sphingobium yanoikuyae]|uniref:Uncharacterized protein n=1 Tax=Sphingobium yanoikuyae TaxID=13690 RepID=A0A430BBD0_SPHYA|nr:hypothetical protein [Sphingobium yanoikuyae]RSU45861.1 hypothetical protein DAH51_26940 [Sphingobium yanoikuyae]
MLLYYMEWMRVGRTPGKALPRRVNDVVDMQILLRPTPQSWPIVFACSSPLAEDGMRSRRGYEIKADPIGGLCRQTEQIRQASSNGAITGSAENPLPFDSRVLDQREKGPSERGDRLGKRPLISVI